MSVASRSARRALYRDFYDLIPLFSSFSPSPVPGRSVRRAPISFKRSISAAACRRLQVEVQSAHDVTPPIGVVRRDHRQLPLACPGCGALTQSVHPHEAGYYSTSRAAVKKYLNPSPAQSSQGPREEDEIVRNALVNVSSELRAQLGMDNLETAPEVLEGNRAEPVIPICDRCHSLIHHHSGIPIDHPSLDAIEATIAESPHKYNHIYHVIDAADFPMSLVPSLTRRLDFAWIRGRNRRAKTQHWSGGKSGEMSFIITRSDLLAPKKEQVDSLMPQLREILRDALGKSGDRARLGNVRLVSSKRGWWTREVKTTIWERGGANWLVGKANVGKSNIFEVIYPKGTNDDTPNFQGARDEARRASVQSALAAEEHLLPDTDQIGVANFKPTDTEPEPEPESKPEDERVADFHNTSSLLPPPQPEVNYPVMPIISSLPGTTASPIRIPFGKGKGELIDLPGLERRTLEPYVKPEHQLDIVMKRRVTPERIVIKPGSSLVLGGGLIRITPKTPGLIFMAHAFVPMSTHLTSTQKAMELENGERDINIASIVNDEKKGSVAQAGLFKLSSNVTKKYAGPLTRRDDVGLNVSRLPFVVWATDILIEGCGWVEVVAQVRKPRRTPAWCDDVDAVAKRSEGQEQGSDASWSPMDVKDLPPSMNDTASFPSSTASAAAWTPPQLRTDITPTADCTSQERRNESRHPLDLSPDELAKTMPEIEVYSPEGKFIGQRPSLSCWLLGGPQNKKTSGRPRKSMKGAKKLEKQRRREAEAATD